MSPEAAGDGEDGTVRRPGAGSLAQRLRTLRGTPRPDGDGGDLARRIERLRTLNGEHGRQERMDEAALAHRLGAASRAPGLWVLERRLPFGTRHGRVALTPPDPAAAGLPGFDGVGQGDWLFLDTETTGLSGGSGTLVFLLALARFGAGGLVLRQYLITRFAAEAAMLEALAADLAGGETLVSYNGKSFDLPLLATRFRLHAIANPLAALGHLDLLHPVRRRFGRSWPNCRLATLESRLLDFERTRDLPGAEAPGAWLDFVRLGRGGRLPGVVRHNQLDLLSLAAAFPALAMPEQGTRSPAGAAGTVDALGRERLRALRLALARPTPSPVSCPGQT